MKRNLISYLSGLLFGLGLALSGMTQPAKVIGFLDFFGNWDPTLMLVMAGAIGVHIFAYRFIKHRASPFFDSEFHIPSKKKIDFKLIIGSCLFGIGWGIGGYCPGPAITSLITLNSTVVGFIAAMIGGMYLEKWLVKR